MVGCEATILGVCASVRVGKGNTVLRPVFLTAQCQYCLKNKQKHEPKMAKSLPRL